MELNTTYYNNNSRVVTGTPQIYTDDVILLCDTGLAPVVINLLEIPDNQWLTTYKLYIIDNSNNASVNNITINAGIGQTINNLPSVVISKNGECGLVRIVGNSQYSVAKTNVANPLSVLDEGTLLTSNAASLNFTGTGVTATNVGDAVTVNVPIQPAYNTVQEEGVSLPQRTTIDFQGTGVTATDNGSKTIVTIPTQQAYTTVEDEGVALPQRTNIDFQGAGVTATDNGVKTIVTIAGSTPTTLAVTDTPTIDLTLTGGPAYNLQADIVDTGWVDLEGFDYYTGLQKPQCRKIGKVVHFRGVVIIPLSNDGGATVIPVVDSTTYYTQYFKEPWVGSGGGFGNGVTLNPAGALTFNLDSSVIPTSVLAGGTNFDDSYAKQTIAFRTVQQAPNTTTAYSAVMAAVITNDKKLRIQVLKDIEQGIGYASFFASSPARLITSSTRVTGTGNDFVPKYVGANTLIHNANLGLTYSLTGELAGPTWAIGLDAGEETDVGGFVVRLDGLTAFIS